MAQQDLRIQISRRIRSLRAKHGLTQQELAETAELDYKSVQRLEAKRPRFYPRVDTLAKLAKAFDVSLSELPKF
jgi:transcriptional regulator with XRE-family HTH domain